MRSVVKREDQKERASSEYEQHQFSWSRIKLITQCPQHHWYLWRSPLKPLSPPKKQADISLEHPAKKNSKDNLDTNTNNAAKYKENAAKRKKTLSFQQPN